MTDPTPIDPPDPLTGIPGRRAFLATLDATLAGATSADLDTLWVGVMAIPRLTFVNAGLGPEAGDDVIRGVARTMIAELPEAFATARLEGAELAMASFGPARRLSRRDTTDPVRFLGIAVESAGTRLFTNLRAGIAYFRAGDDAAGLLRKARLALASARESDGDDLAIYDDALGALAAERLEIARGLLDAIQGDALELHYQPKIDIRSGEMIGVEALVRWPTPGGGSVSPGAFIPVAEASGLIMPLGDWVLQQGCRQAARWQAQGLPRFHVAINVSALQFQKTDIVARTEALLRETGARPDWLELELTEGALASDTQHVIGKLAEIRRMGIDLAVDDFGTGYSSLSYLKQFPVHRLKIDQSFVRFSHQSEQDRAIVRSIIAIGRNLGLKVIAEGVELADHVALLNDERCTEAQGYYYAKAMEAEALAEFARERGVR